MAKKYSFQIFRNWNFSKINVLLHFIICFFSKIYINIFFIFLKDCSFHWLRIIIEIVLHLLEILYLVNNHYWIIPFQQIKLLVIFIFSWKKRKIKLFFLKVGLLKLKLQSNWLKNISEMVYYTQMLIELIEQNQIQQEIVIFF